MTERRRARRTGWRGPGAAAMWAALTLGATALAGATGCSDGAYGARGAARPADAGAQAGETSSAPPQARSSKSKKPSRATKSGGSSGKTDDKTSGKSQGASARKADPDVAREVGAVQRGEAVWYGGELHGSPTASGERFDKHKLTAAHRTLPMGTTVRVTNEKNGKSVTVRVNDRGPFGKRKDRIIDVSEAAAKLLDFIDDGFCPITLEVLTLPEPRKDKAR